MEQYPLFALADPVFYDSPERWETGRAPFSAAVRPLPDGWSRTTSHAWTVLTPTGHRGPAQGWKIHVSATAANAEQVINTVWGYCLTGGVPFKFLTSPDLHWVFNSKYAPREASGKLVAIYPDDQTQLHRILRELSAELAGQPGPYILSDLRWDQGPLYVRYGGFQDVRCIDAAGDLVMSVQRPDGTRLPDRRQPRFTVPDFVEVPEFLRAQLAGRGSGSQDFPYRVKRSLHFSNAGGVYLATRDDDGSQVVLKEARPHAGLDKAGRDAVERLRHERRVLEELDGLAGIPSLYDYRTVGEHHFIAMEYLPGDFIWKWVARRHPLLNPESTPEQIREFTDRVLAVVDRVTQLVERVHERGVVLGDLHPGNLLVTEDDQVGLVDFEAAGWAADPQFRPLLRAQGFASWEHDRFGADVDRYALAALRLWVFLPLNQVWELDPGKLAEHIDETERRYELPAGYCDGIRRELLSASLAHSTANVISQGRPLEVVLDTEKPDLEAISRSLADAVQLSATPERADRLYPGHVEQFRHDGFGFAYGAAGVLWALSATGFTPRVEHQEWLLMAAERGLRPHPGFFTGVHGVAHVLDQLGHTDTARDLLDQVRDQVAITGQPNLFGGLAGIGLNYLHFAVRTGHEGYLAQARKIAGRLTGLVREGQPTGDTAGVAKAGLLRGWSGLALFLLRLHQLERDPAYLELAVTALHRDLDHCVSLPNGSLQVEDEGIRKRAIVYLDGGSGGIGLVANQVLRHHEDERLRRALPAILLGCQSEYVSEPQLFSGRAGLLAMLCALAGPAPGLRVDESITRHVRRFSWHALSYRGRLAFPGQGSMRLSMDLATGGAGILLAMATARRRRPGFLPFLEDLRLTEASARPTSSGGR